MGSNPVKVPKFFSALIFAIAKSDDDTLHLKSRDKIGIVLPSFSSCEGSGTAKNFPSPKCHTLTG